MEESYPQIQILAGNIAQIVKNVRVPKMIRKSTSELVSSMIDPGFKVKVIL
jgi:hypothetical protein